MTETPSLPWMQQSDESDQAYAAACRYFELGSRRSQQQVVAQGHGTRAAVRRWSVRHTWRARAQAFDHYRLHLETRERQRKLAEAAPTGAPPVAARPDARTWAERLTLAREDEWELAQACLARARAMLAHPLEDTKWNWRDASVLIDRAARLLRQAASEHEASGPDNGPLRVEVVYHDAPPLLDDEDDSLPASTDEEDTP